MRFLVMAMLMMSAPVVSAHEQSAEAKKHADAPTSFEAQPPVGTWAKCAVSGDVFQVQKDTQFATWEGRTYAFCCDDCKPDFVKNPARYAGKKKS